MWSKIPNWLKNKYAITIVIFIVWLSFFDQNNLLIIVHGFIKKTQKTPVQEISIAEKIKRNSPFALKNAIKSINDGYKYDIDGYKSEIQMFSKCFDSLDFNEGVNAFIEKRKPNFN